nr:CNT_HP1_G0015830.mRNA.1.CDS.1 [Saccharomyces cerevisiae]
MSTCIAAQANLWKGSSDLVLFSVSNHPDIGGTHLPDITVISPAFSEQSGEIILCSIQGSSRRHRWYSSWFSASQLKRELYEEGATFFRVDCQKGYFQEELICKLLLEEPAKYPGCSGSRRISDNISDLKAQIAANNKGNSINS